MGGAYRASTTHSHGRNRFRAAASRCAPSVHALVPKHPHMRAQQPPLAAPSMAAAPTPPAARVALAAAGLGLSPTC